jgi:hypothetical protein
MIPLENILKNKFQFYKQCHIGDDTIDNWPYWQLEEMIKILNESNEEEKKAREESEKNQKKNMPNMNPSSYMNYAKSLGRRK